jgi:hypothetical protein
MNLDACAGEFVWGRRIDLIPFLVGVLFHLHAGSGWMFYFVVIVQTTINTGVSIGSILLAADCIEVRPAYLPTTPENLLVSLRR